MELNDTYKTITSPTESVLFKEKNSKFYGYAYPVVNEDAIKKHLTAVKKQHHSARHWCYAYKIGTEQPVFRVNDDGEPSNSAGMPIYGQILSFEVTNVLVIVVRYFGGVKLGIGGLIQAYKTTALLSLESSKIIEKTIDVQFQITFEYKEMNKVMRIIKERQLQITNQQLELNCIITISVRKSESEKIFEVFNSVYGVSIEKI
ncbi:YigZ family protein [Hyunsoonleella flava]|uniref:YigZ family protein n=1 Tax=Hyunsoonleella flava TaxID=2527939 RepID=A0A4Q9FFG7_9FLAO|nr:YigZ family protein [Hyunsoonleella flava]TBN04390.1 YigZ family protein [Hyunsoonleella flava]